MAEIKGLNVDDGVSGVLISPGLFSKMLSIEDAKLEITQYAEDGNTFAPEPVVELWNSDTNDRFASAPLGKLIADALEDAEEFGNEASLRWWSDEDARRPGFQAKGLTGWKHHQLLKRLAAAFTEWREDEALLDYDGALAREADKPAP